MKKLLQIILVLASFITIANAQPQKITYQAVVRDANNALIANTTIGIRVTLYHDSINNGAEYVETHTAITNHNALVTIEIGAGTPMMSNNTIADIDWKNHRVFLKIEIDPTGGTNYTISGIQEFLTVPYAFYAETTSHVDTALYANNSGNAINAVRATYSDTTLYSINSNHSVYADTADYNKLVNKPIGANHGDILYWESSDSSWHIVPVGNIGETLTLDSNKTPHWSSNAAPTIVLPTIITDTILNITTISARATGTVSADGGSPFVFSGLCWGTTQNPTTADFHTLNGIGLGSVSSDLLSLTMGTVYYVRAFATNSAGTAYGNELSFRTQTYPVVTTNAVSNISTYAAISGGNVTDDGGATVTARGVCWSSTSTAPTTADSHTTDGTGTGSFLSSMTPLSRNTKYYVRAYATNYIGTTYGDTVSFTTLADFPTVTTSAVGSITSVTAVVGGNVTDDGDATVTARGICWNSTGNPTLADNVLPIGNGYGSFSSTLTGLTASTVYYVCAYATNTIGTSYGSTISFTTAAPFTCGISTITDYDNNAYNTVQLGSQCWMAENLRTTHYANGSTITLMTSTTTSSTTGYRYYPGGSSSNVPTYGYLYNWYATMKGAASSSANPSGVQGICPTGWHIPSNAEWIQLTDYISSQSQYWCGGTSNAIAKSLASTIGWTSASTSCYVGYSSSTNNSSGFNGTPSGYFYTSGGTEMGNRVYYWSTTEYNSTSVNVKRLYYNTTTVGSYNYDKTYGLTVRCVKD